MKNQDNISKFKKVPGRQNVNNLKKNSRIVFFVTHAKERPYDLFLWNLWKFIVQSDKPTLSDAEQNLLNSSYTDDEFDKEVVSLRIVVPTLTVRMLNQL